LNFINIKQRRKSCQSLFKKCLNPLLFVEAIYCNLGLLKTLKFLMSSRGVLRKQNDVVISKASELKIATAPAELRNDNKKYFLIALNLYGRYTIEAGNFFLFISGKNRIIFILSEINSKIKCV